MKERIRELDYLRGFAVLAVLAIHTFANFTRIKGVNKLLTTTLMVDALMQFAVPCFLFISGFALYRNYGSKFHLGTFYLNRAKSIIPQYILFSIAYMVFNHTPFTVENVVQNLLNGKASYHLWFFVVIIQFYLIYPILAKLYRFFANRGRSREIILAVLAVQMLWNLYPQKIPYITWPFIAGMLFYFFLGFFVAQHFDDLKEKLFKHLSAYALWPAYLLLGFTYGSFWLTGIIVKHNFKAYRQGTLFLDPIFFALVFLLLYKIAVWLEKRNNLFSRFALSIGKYSFGIYLIHIFFNTAAVSVLAKFHLTPQTWQFYPLLFLASFVPSLISTYLISRLPFGQYIVGVKTSKS